MNKKIGLAFCRENEKQLKSTLLTYSIGFKKNDHSALSHTILHTKNILYWRQNLDTNQITNANLTYRPTKKP